MELHRAQRKSDWDTVSSADRNVWQKAAAKTHGVVTPGNAITVIGLLLVVYGSLHIGWHNYWLAFGVLAIGRLCDLLDGYAADKTGTKSILGELFDVAADKLGMVAVIVACFAAQIAPAQLLVLLIAPHVIIAFLPFLNPKQHGDVHPTRLGKITMAATWLCFGAYLLIAATGSTYTVAIGYANIFTLLTVIASFYNVALYARQWR